MQFFLIFKGSLQVLLGHISLQKFSLQSKEKIYLSTLSLIGYELAPLNAE